MIIKKISQTHGFNPTHVGWVGSGWTYMMDRVGLNFFLPTMMGWVKKSPQPNPTRPMHTPSFNVFIKTIFKICDDGSPYSLKLSFSTHSLQIYCLGLVGPVHNQFGPQTETPQLAPSVGRLVH